MAIFRFEDRVRERRRSQRFELHYLAMIERGSGASPLNCVICDMSEIGAKLTVGPHEVPDEFVLVLKRRCRVVRRSEGQVGVKFVQS